MISHSNNQTSTVTIYTYTVEKLYIVSILSLLRVSIYIKLLYGGLVIDVSNGVHYFPSLISTANHFFKTSEEFLRQTRKTAKSHLLVAFSPLHTLANRPCVSRDIRRASN